MKIKSITKEILILIISGVLIAGYAMFAGAQSDDGLMPATDDGLAPMVDDETDNITNDVVTKNNSDLGGKVGEIASQLRSLEQISFDEKKAKEIFDRKDFKSLILFDDGVKKPILYRPNPFLPVK